MTQKESLPYQKMMGEVEAIVAELSSPNLDLDEMVVKVEKGYALIHKMRERLNTVKGKIEKLHAEYSEPAAVEKPTSSDDIPF